MEKLTPKQESFCREYLKDFNGTRAAIAAGYSKRSAASTAVSNLMKPNIKKRLDELREKRNTRVQIDADYVLNKINEIVNLDVADILDAKTGGLLPVVDWPKAWRTSIAGFEVIKLNGIYGVKNVKWPDKLKALELLGKHTKVKAWTHDEEHGEIGQPLQISFNVADAKGPIKVTTGGSKA